MAPKRSNKGKEEVDYDDKSVSEIPSSMATKRNNKDKDKFDNDDQNVFKVPSSIAPNKSNKGKERIDNDDKNVFKVPSSIGLKRCNKGKEKIDNDDKSVFKVPSSMASIRSNKGKEKIDDNDKNVFKVSGMSSIGQRVGLSKKIEVHVYSIEGEDNFESLFKVSRRTFNHIRSLVREHMISGYTNFTFIDGKHMTLNDQIAISLIRLSSVDTSINIAMMFGTNNWTVDMVTLEFVRALEAHALQHISWPSDIPHMKMRFESISGMPNCYGAIETTHVKLYPHKSEQGTIVWLDSNNNNSMQLQVIVDPTMRFVDVVSGFPGCMTKDGVLEESEIFSLAQKGEALNGNEVVLSGTKIREYLVGDSGFQLLPWLITPYRDDKLTNDQIEFNQKHLVTRAVASRALKKLKEVWAVIDGGLWQPNRHNLPRIILACCQLHNILIEMEGNIVSVESMTSFDHDPGYPQEKSTLPDDKDAAVVRDELCLYLAGKLPVYIG